MLKRLSVLALLALLPAANTHDPVADAERHAEHAAALALVPHDAVTHTATGGSWCDPATWGEAVPGDGARVLVPAGVTVTMDCDAKADTIRVDGALEWANVAQGLEVHTLFVDTTGRLEIGTPEAPVTADVEVVFRGALDLATDPTLLGLGVLAHGETVIHGAPKTPHGKVAADPMAGDTSITLAEAPKGWRPGDTIVIAGTHYDGYKWDGERVSHHPPEDEVLTVASVDGNVVSFAAPLVHDHDSPRPDLKTSVANLSRSVTFRSASTAERGHFMLMHSPKGDVRYAAFVDMGRTDKSLPLIFDLKGETPDDPADNVRGRYPFHVHRTGASGQPAYAIGNAVSGSPGWCYTHHDANAVLARNVAYDCYGAGIVAETGNETGRWSENLVIYAKGRNWGTPKTGMSSDSGEFQNFDLAFTGDGFWFQGRMVAADGNIAASVNTGFAYFHRAPKGAALPVNPADWAFPVLGHEPAEINKPAIRGFSDNETFAARSGLHVEKANPKQRHDVYTHLTDFTAWSVLAGAEIGYTAHYILEDFDLVARAPARFSEPRAGISFGPNVSDMTVVSPRIAGFPEGIVTSRHFTDRTFDPAGAGYAILGAEIAGADQPLVGFVAEDMIGDVPPETALSVDLAPVVYGWNTSPAHTVPIRGAKSDSLGIIELPPGQDDYDRDATWMRNHLATAGWWTMGDRRVFLFDAYWTDRLTGQVYRTTHLGEISPEVRIDQWSTFRDAVYRGELAAVPDSTPVAVADPEPAQIPQTPEPKPEPTPEPDLAQAIRAIIAQLTALLAQIEGD